MKRKEYLDRLRVCLQGIPLDEIEDILSDYEEHFDIGISKGKSEEEISKELGEPREVANNYRTTYKPNYNNNNNYSTNISNDNTRKLLITLLLIAFNIIVVFAPFMTLVALLIGLYAASIGFIIGGFVILFGFPITIFAPIPVPHILTSTSFGIGFLALGALGIILSIYLTKGFYKLVVKYAQWNIELINK